MDKGREYINKPYSIMLAKDHDYENPTDEDFFAINSAKSTTADEILVSILKDVRRDIANREDIPPYVIFQDNSINEMAIQYPIVEEELLQISGVGVGKAKKYGEPFMNVIAKYVEDNDIIRPVDMVIKSPIRNSLTNGFIIQNIDRKLPLDELAQARNATMEELLIEMEKIVLSGTKIEIDYYIDNTIEDWHQEEIWDYFLDTEIDDLQEAFDDLVDDEITEDEVRMMRIKFLSEYGN
jgi:ATP-dependent DNA helicase RecQ